MQKILRRVGTAERVAAKRTKAKDLKLFKKEKKEQSSEHQQQLATLHSEFNAAKKALKDDWELGPLAPRRDVGEWAGAKGAIHEGRFALYHRIPLVLRNRRCQWAGGFYNLNLAVGDRVVLLDGPDKGRIGAISTIEYDQAEVVIRGLNKTNVRMPISLRREQDPVAISVELPLPISSVRLVHPIKDPETGLTRDVIINQLVHGGFLHDRVSGKRRWSRIVPGLNISIPWPKKEEPDIKDNKSDTLRIDLEERTFVPTLLTPPMPESLINELRNRYSRFRTRHEPEYIARLEAEEQAKVDRRKLIESMRTPLQEFHRAEREGKKKKGKPRLTVEMLEKIGEVMAKNMERTRNASALLEAGSSSSGGGGGGGDATSSDQKATPTPPPETTTEETPPPPSA